MRASQPGDVAPSPLSILQEQGFVLMKEVVQPELIHELSATFADEFRATPVSQGPFYGDHSKRFHGLLALSPLMDQIVRCAPILKLVEAILGPACERFQLNLTQAIELLPGGMPQPPHRDQDMWPGPKGGFEYLVNVMWPLSPFRGDNGATIIWPGSHRRQEEIVMDPSAAICPPMAPGSALIFLGSTLHAGGANRSRYPRRGMVISYCLGWLKPYELPWLAYPPDVARSFSPELAALAGYKVHRPNLGTFDGRCPSFLLEDSERKRLGAIDALLPEQEALIGRYFAGELGPIAGV
ncbi:phytanoyl-CoA dioxygenase family protein [Sphingobium naphthae]|nr:phytanoyl-CoA dioxygenase family protein [Sphingobium naphthae]